MRGSIFLRILAGVILLAALVFLGALIYNAGIAQGLATSSLAPSNGQGAPNIQGVPQPYFYAPFYRPWGFGLFWPIFPLLFLLLIFFAVRGLFFAGWRHRNWGRGYGPAGWGQGEVPPMVKEWHRKMHEGQPEQDAPPE